MTWRVTVDAGLCISSGVCLGTAPGRFRFDESEHATPVRALTEPDEQRSEEHTSELQSPA